MLQFNKAYSSTSSEVEFSEAPAPTPIDFVSVAIGILRRQWRMLAISLVVTAVAALLYFFNATPTYITVATLVIDTGKFQLFTPQAGSLGEATLDSAAALESQLEIIKSEKIALKVISDLHLVDTLAPIRQPWFGAPEPLSDFKRTRNALAVFEKRLTVARRGMALMIEIGFSSSNPELSAQVANAVADTYVNDHMEAKYEATRLGSAWLEKRIADLRVQSEVAAHAVVEFKATNNIVDAGAGRLNEQQLTEVSGQLGLTRAQTAEAKARLDRITAIARSGNEEAIINAALSGALSNDNITKLRAQYTELNSRATEFEQKYGRNHLSVVNLRTQMAQLRAAMLDEVNRLTQSYESDFNLAAAREKNLENEVARLVAQSETTSRASVKLHELESAAQISSTLHENFRKRYVESVEQQAFPVPEARVLTRAVPPLDREYKGLIKWIGAIFGAGASLGVGAALFRELIDRTYRTVAQVERRLQVSCLAMVPHVESRLEQKANPAASSGLMRDKQIFDIPHGPIWHVVGSPLSVYAEALRSVKLALDLNAGNKSIKIVGVTSTLPREGKSTIAASLALTIGRTGAQVILVDCDLRNPALTRAFVPGVAQGFVEVLSGEITLQDALWTDRAGLISFLPVVFDPRFFQSTEVMASKAAKKFFEGLRHTYDYVIVDLPPLAPIVDTRATTPLIDASVFVIGWGSTKINVVEHALAREPGVCENMLGAVLNNVDMNLLRSYDEKNSSLYKNSHYSQYGFDE